MTVSAPPLLQVNEKVVFGEFPAAQLAAGDVVVRRIDHLPRSTFDLFAFAIVKLLSWLVSTFLYRVKRYDALEVVREDSPADIQP